MPFKGFLGPSSETADLTRILRRRLARTVYHIPPDHSREYTKIFVYLQIINNKGRRRSRLYAIFRQRIVAISARVQTRSGEKAASLSPVITPWSTAQPTAWA